ncbi:hypothetical protein D3C78_465650 [compost metagenome]
MRMARQTEIEALLNSLSKEELIRIIAQVVEQDEMFSNSFLLRYAKGDHSQQIQTCKKLIDSIVKKYVGREGFIPYRETCGFASEMLKLLEDMNGAQDESLALEIALLVLEEGIAAFQYADDSDGDIGMLVGEALERIQEIAGSQDRQDISARERFFERLLSVSKSGIFQGWEDSQIALFGICAEFADVEKFREQLKEAIEHQIASNANNEYREYSNEALLQILFQIIQDYGSGEEAERFVQEHLQFTFFRRWAIEKSMAARNYRRAIELAEEGEQQDKQFPGLISRWKVARYEAYKKLSLRQEQMELAKELLLDGDYDYYHELESLFQGDKEEFYRSILQELKKANHWRTWDVYLKLISEKNDLEEMMVYVRANPSTIEEYAARLSADYHEEMTRIYSNYIYSAASTSSNRKGYQRVCAILKRYKKAVGKPSQEEIILQLKAQYYTRPAFMDELAKLT